MKDVKSVIVMMMMFLAFAVIMALPLLAAMVFNTPMLLGWWIVILPFIVYITKLVTRRLYPNEALSRLEQDESHFVVSVIDTKHPSRHGTVAIDI